MHVVAVGAETFAFGEGLSPDVAAAVPEILSTVAGLFREGRPGGAEAP